MAAQKLVFLYIFYNRLKIKKRSFPCAIFRKLIFLHSINAMWLRFRARFSWRSLRSKKIVKENWPRGWFWDGPRSLKQGLVKSCLLLPRTKSSKNRVFSASVNFTAFFDRYLAVKSHICVDKFFVEFINVSKTGFESKIRTPWAEILAFFRGKVRRNSISWTIENFKTRIYWKFGLFWKACIITFQKSNICPNKLLEISELFEKFHF